MLKSNFKKILFSFFIFFFKKKDLKKIVVWKTGKFFFSFPASMHLVVWSKDQVLNSFEYFVSFPPLAAAAAAAVV